MSCSPRLGALGAALLLSPGLQAQVLVEPGFELEQVLPGPDAAYVTLSSGDLFTFDGQDFSLVTSGGQLILALGSLPASVFTGGIAVDPTETFGVVGESSNGDIFRVDLGGGGVTTIGNAFFNYDIAFDIDPDFVFISAALAGFGSGNDLVRLNAWTGASSQVAHVGGASGPLAVDAAGDLIYATQSDAWPPPFGTTRILRFDRQDILSGNTLAESDAAVLTDTLNGATSLAIEPVFGHIFLCENNGQAPNNRLLQIDPDSGEVIDVVAEAPTWISNLELAYGAGSGHFRAHQPANARLLLNDTDFGLQTSDRVTISPRRPTSTITGPVGGAGAFTLTVEGAEPNAAVLVYFGLQSETRATTYDLPNFDFRWHTALALGDFRRLPLMTPTDASGTATFQYFDPGTLGGLYTFQAMILEPSAKVIGSAEHVLN